MTKHPDLFAALASPFEPHEVKTRPQGGVKLQYITARTAMNRLDNVLGPEGWWDDFEAHEHSVVCRLSVRLPDGSVVTKCDAGGYAGMSDQGDDDKSGYSDAFKRAAVKFGVGRYLYRDGVPTFVAEMFGEVVAPRANHAPARGESPPTLARQSGQQPQNGQNYGPPRSGKGLFAWTKEQEQKYEVGLLKYLNEWSKLHDFPGRMVDWTPDQVKAGYDEACRKLHGVEPQHADATVTEDNLGDDLPF